VRGWVGFGVVAALLLAAPAEAAPRTHVIVMEKMKFQSVPASVRRGDTILWENRDMFRHTATAKNGAFNVDLAPGAKGKTIIQKSGALAFVCKYHPGMRGVLKVSQ
jgi:plastocyanin